MTMRNRKNNDKNSRRSLSVSAKVVTNQHALVVANPTRPVFVQSNKPVLNHIPTSRPKSTIITKTKEDNTQKKKSNQITSSVYLSGTNGENFDTKKERSKSVSAFKRSNEIMSKHEVIQKEVQQDDRRPLKYLTNSTSAVAVTVSSTTSTTNLLPSKTYQKASQNNNTNNNNQHIYSSSVAPVTTSTSSKTTSLFHPSKINMSSTPIKSTIRDDYYDSGKNKYIFLHSYALIKLKFLKNDFKMAIIIIIIFSIFLYIFLSLNYAKTKLRLKT